MVRQSERVKLINLTKKIMLYIQLVSHNKYNDFVNIKYRLIHLLEKRFIIKKWGKQSKLRFKKKKFIKLYQLRNKYLL